MTKLVFVLAGIIITSQLFVVKANARSSLELCQSHYAVCHDKNYLGNSVPVLSAENIRRLHKKMLSLPLQKEVLPHKISNVLDKKAEGCSSPSFWLKKSCWVILKDGEDCLVEPVIMQLEDRPVYCPREQIKKLTEIKTDDYQQHRGLSVL